MWNNFVVLHCFCTWFALVAGADDWFEVTDFHNKAHEVVMLRKTNIGPPTCYEYQVLTSDKTRVLKMKLFCYPSIVISGKRKCGTSAMYQLLLSSPDILPSNIIKEHCNTVVGGFLEFLNELPESVPAGKHLLSGCPERNTNLRLHGWLRRPKTKFIYLTRDYADWLWAAYNYWCSSGYEECKDGTKTNLKINQRSPELFHQLVLDSNARNASKAINPVTLFEMHSLTPCEYAHDVFSADIKYTWERIAPSDTLIIASEDVEEKLEEVVTRITSFANITLSKQAVEAFGKVRYNTQVSESARNRKSAVAADQMVNGRYAISGFRPMLNETKQLLDRCWLKDCIWVSAITGRAYEACSSVHKHYDVLSNVLLTTQT